MTPLAIGGCLALMGIGRSLRRERPQHAFLDGNVSETSWKRDGEKPVRFLPRDFQAAHRRKRLHPAGRSHRRHACQPRTAGYAPAQASNPISEVCRLAV